MWDYTEKVKDHFINPRNVGVVDNPDGIGEVGSLACGDALKLTFSLGEDQTIKDAKFQTFGCASAIASSSALTEIIKGMTLEEAEKVTNDDIADYLGGLPKEKMHCSVMGREALEKAITFCRGEPEKKKEGEVVCECFGITDVEIRNAVSGNGLSSIADVTDYIKAGGGCGNCHDKIQDIIESVKTSNGSAGKRPAKMTNIQKIKLVEDVLEREIKPVLAKDGGDIELVDVDGDDVMVKMLGACSGCQTSQVTLKNFVQTKVRELVSPDLNVKEVKKDECHIC